jgi:hypothetical protein
MSTLSLVTRSRPLPQRTASRRESRAFTPAAPAPTSSVIDGPGDDRVVGGTASDRRTATAAPTGSRAAAATTG